jgi:hypothetical protein
MNKKRYKTNKLISLVFIILTGGTLGMFFLNSTDFKIDLVMVGAFIFITFLFVDLMYGTYLSLENNTFSRTDYFLIKKKLKLNEIEIIRYQPTYGSGREFSSLYIFEKSRSKAAFIMTNIWFKEEILSGLVKDLKQINPNIRLDDETKSLIKKYGNL